jgi:hypothetical protein
LLARLPSSTPRRYSFAFSSPLELPSMRGILPLVFLAPGAGPCHVCVCPVGGADRLTRLDSKDTSVPTQHLGVRRIRPVPRKRQALGWGPVWGGTKHSGIARSGLPLRRHRRTGPPGDRGPGERPPGGRSPNGRPEGERRSGPAGGAGGRCSFTCWWPPSLRRSPRPSRVAEYSWRFLRSGPCWCARWSSTPRIDLLDRGSATRVSWPLI